MREGGTHSVAEGETACGGRVVIPKPLNAPEFATLTEKREERRVVVARLCLAFKTTILKI